MSQAKLQPVRGTHDIYFKEAKEFRAIQAVAREVGRLYGFDDLHTPIFEFTEVFKRTLGDTSDVVNKEMYSFEDRGGESLTLRPEFTAGIARAFISNGMQQHLPLKLFSTGPLFRYERPQKGRQRQFHQINFEYLGDASPYADAEMILLGGHILSRLGILQYATLELNTLGDAPSRKAYTEALVKYFSAHKAELSEESKLRLEKNPLRILDSKDANDKKLVAGAPKMQDYLTPEAAKFFETVIEVLKQSPLKDRFRINPSIVRGLDYYSHTVFEFVASGEEIGAQNTVLAGGRYDGLIEQMGGPATPAVGFAAGIERLMLLADLPLKTRAPIAVVAIGEATRTHAFLLTESLRGMGRKTLFLEGSNFGKVLKKADKAKASHAIIIGENELASMSYVFKNLSTGAQENVSHDALPDYLKSLETVTYEL